jgi:hypothetical protein
LQQAGAPPGQMSMRDMLMAAAQGGG